MSSFRLSIASFMLLLMAAIDRWGFYDRQAFLVELVGGMVLAGMAFAVKDDKG